jgi:hypothetical protein
MIRNRTAVLAAIATASAGTAVGLLSAEADYSTRSDPSRCAISETRTQHTVVSNSYARIWERHRTSRGTPVVDYYACSNRARRNIRMATVRQPTNGDRHETVELSEDSINASFVAFVAQTCPNGFGNPCSYDLRQLRLKDGRLVRRITSDSAYLTRALVFGAGQLAYGRGTPGCVPCEVRTVVGESDRVVGSGREVNLQSLALGNDGMSAGTVIWIDGSHARAAVPGGSDFD